MGCPIARPLRPANVGLGDDRGGASGRNPALSLIACDEEFGRDTVLLDKIAAGGLWYFAKVPHDTQVWQVHPGVAVPEWSGRGRKPTCQHLVADATAPQTVAALATALPTRSWSRQLIQEGSQGPQVAEFALVRVISVRDGLPGPEVWLVLRRSLSAGELKTYLCNAPADIPQQQLVHTSGLRWPLEICFETGKQELGMGDYEVRSWRGWHHHMTLVILALGFLVRVQKRLKKSFRPNPAAGAVLGRTHYPTTHVRCAVGAGSPGVLARRELSGVSVASQTKFGPPRSAGVIKSRCNTSEFAETSGHRQALKRPPRTPTFLASLL